MKLVIEDLKRELGELRQTYPKFSSEDIFVLWFLRAYLTDSLDAAAGAITNGKNDKGIDAILVDDTSRSVFLVQGKYRETVGQKSEARNDVLGFAGIAKMLCGNSEVEFSGLVEGADPGIAKKLREARNRILQRKYRLWLYYVTLGTCSKPLREEADKIARKAAGKTQLIILDGHRVMSLLRDYLDGVAPPIPALDLEMEKGAGVDVTGIMQRYEHGSDIESWVFSMRGDAVASLFEIGGIRLFARNIRGFLGPTQINDGMAATLTHEPSRFFYYNNGITILCDDAESRKSKGQEFLQVSNPQVINGQQTTRVLARMPKEARKASVLVKVIKVPRDTADDGFDQLVSRVVQGTNWQNAIRPSDLMTNDRTQIELERELRKRSYVYLRKRESKSEGRAAFGGRQFFVVTKEEIARAVAGCDLDPTIARSGREHLFQKEMYGSIFPNSNPNYYLPRYWLMKVVSSCSKGKPERAYVKWLVLGFVWNELEVLVRSKKGAQVLIGSCEGRNPKLLDPLARSIDRVFVAALKYYRENRGSGASVMDISNFFRSKRGRNKEFREFWDSPKNKESRSFDSHWAKVVASIEELTAG